MGGAGVVEELFGELHQQGQHHEHVRGGKGNRERGAEAAQQLAHGDWCHPRDHQGQEQTRQQERDAPLEHDIDRQARQLGTLDRGRRRRQDREDPQRGETGHKGGDAEQGLGDPIKDVDQRLTSRDRNQGNPEGQGKEHDRRDLGLGEGREGIHRDEEFGEIQGLRGLEQARLEEGGVMPAGEAQGHQQHRQQHHQPKTEQHQGRAAEQATGLPELQAPHTGDQGNAQKGQDRHLEEPNEAIA